MVHTVSVTWEVDFDDAFVMEYRALHKDVQDELLACIVLLEHFGHNSDGPARILSTIRVTPI
jgi:hypothetical protein